MKSEIRTYLDGSTHVCRVLLEFSSLSLVVLSTYLRQMTGEGHEELSHSLGRPRDNCMGIYCATIAVGIVPCGESPSVALDVVSRKLEEIIAKKMLVLNHSDSASNFRWDNGQESWF